MDSSKKEVVVKLSPSVAKMELKCSMCFDDDIDKYTIEDAVNYLLDKVPWKPDRRGLANQLKNDMTGRKTLSAITHGGYTQDWKQHRCTKECPSTTVSLNEGIGEYLSLAHSQKHGVDFYILDLTLAKTQSGGEE